MTRPPRRTMRGRGDGWLAKVTRWIDRYDGWVFSVVILVIVLASIANATLSYDPDSRQSGGANQQTAPHDASAQEPLECIYLPTIRGITDCVEKDVRASEKESRDQRDLNAQREMSRWAFGVFWTGLLALFVSSLGLGALFYTFREQRKLFQNQERAVIDLVGGMLYFHPVSFEAGYTFEIGVFNSGRTHAYDVEIKGKLRWHPSVSDDNVADGELIEEEVSVDIGWVGPNSVGVLNDQFTTEMRPKHIWDARFGSAGPGAGTEHSADESITFSGTLSYFDAFERRHEGLVGFTIWTIKTGHPAELDFSGSWGHKKYNAIRRGEPIPYNRTPPPPEPDWVPFKQRPRPLKIRKDF